VKTYELTLPDILVVSLILSEVAMFHVLEHESQWELGNGAHSDELHDVLIFEATAPQRFLAEPLPVDFQLKGHITYEYHSPHRSVSSSTMRSIGKT